MQSFDVEVSGFAKDGFEPMVNAFARTLAYGGGRGAALAIYQGGELVVDLTGGDYDPGSLQLQFSVSKLITAIMAAHAASHGRLDLDEPLSAYWKALDRDTTRRITPRMVLAHTSGLAGVSTPLTIEDLIAGRYIEELEREDPYWEPGTQPGYHSHSYGALLDEIFKRRLGRPVGEYFEAEIRQGLGLEVWYGAPADQVHRVKPYQRPVEGLTPLARAIPTLRPFTDHGASVIRGDYSVANRPDVLAQSWAGMSIVATARDMAKLLAATTGQIAGRRVLEPDALKEMRKEQSKGIDWVLRYPIRFGQGVQLPFPQLTFTGPNSFGHQGAGGCVTFADTDRDIAVSYNTDGFPACEGASLLAVALFSTIAFLAADR